MLQHVLLYISVLFAMFTVFKITLFWYASDVFEQLVHTHMQDAISMQAEYNAHSILNSTLNQAQTYFWQQQHVIDYYS